jgi:hypothetical protein
MKVLLTPDGQIPRQMIKPGPSGTLLDMARWWRRFLGLPDAGDDSRRNQFVDETVSANDTSGSPLDLAIQLQLANAITHGDREARHAAAQALSGSPLHIAIQTQLANALKATDPELRAAAARALRR